MKTLLIITVVFLSQSICGIEQFANSALQIGLCRNDVEIVQIALERGADPNLSINEFQLRPLMFASITLNAPMVELLLAKGASVDACSSHGSSVLHHFLSCVRNEASPGYQSILTAILSKQPDLSIVDHSGDFTGWTPLMLAAWHGQLNAAKGLLPRASEILNNRIPSGYLEGFSAWNLASQAGHDRIARLLLQAGATQFEVPKKDVSRAGYMAGMHPDEMTKSQAQEFLAACGDA